MRVGLEKMREDDAKAETLEEAQARADLTIAQAKRKSEISDATDPADLEKTTLERATADLDAAAARIKDPQRAALFRETYRPSIAGLGITAKDRAFALQTDAAKADAFEQLERLKQTAVSSSDPAVKEQAIRDGASILNRLNENGYIGDEEVAKRRKAWTQSYAYDAVQAIPSPISRLAAVRGGWEGALINRESSGNPRVVNPFGYAGLYQMGAPLLTTLGLYTPGANENLQTWSDTPKDTPGKWSGSFNIPGFPGVRTLAEFRGNPDAQRAAFLQSTAYYDTQIKELGLDQFIGKTVQGVPITLEGVYSMMHLGGVKGAESALKRGQNAKDANGSSVLAYARMAAEAGPGITAFLSPEQKLAVADGAARELAAQERQAQRARQDEAAGVRSRIGDDLASIERTGQGNASLRPQEVEQALGTQASQDWLAQRGRAHRVFEALEGIEGLPEGEVERRLQTLEPRPGGEGYAEDMEAYTRARSKADKFLQARRADPALAVEALPTVKEARAAAQYEGDGDKRRITPQSAQAIVRARLATQNQLGIPEPMAVTRSEASTIARQLRYVGDDDVSGMQRFVQQLQGTYGEYADEVLAATIQHQNINRDLAVAATEVLNKIGRGQVPNPFDQNRLERASNAQRMDDALAGRSAQPAPAGQPATPRGPARGDRAGAENRGAAEAGEFQGAATGKDLQALYENRNDPAVLTEFEATYGPGTAKRALTEIDRRLGTQERR